MLLLEHSLSLSLCPGAEAAGGGEATAGESFRELRFETMLETMEKVGDWNFRGAAGGDSLLGGGA